MNAHPHPNPNSSTEERKIINEAADTPSMLDEKKLLEERRRRLEASLHEHVEELKDRGRYAGKVALVGAAGLLGVWLVAKAVGSINGRRQHKKARALKEYRQLGALTPGGVPDAAAPEPAPRPGSAASHDYSYDAPPVGSGYEVSAPRRAARRPPVPEEREPSMFQTFLESEAGRMMTNQLVALLMVFVTTRLEGLLKIDRRPDIGSVKESDLTPYRIVDPVSDATVVPDDADARPHAPYSPPDASA